MPVLSAPLITAAELLDDFAAIWAEGTDEECKVLIHTFVQEVVAHPATGVLRLRIKIEYQPLFSILDVRN